MVTPERIEAGCLEQPRVQGQLRDAQDRGARINFLIREKEGVGKSQHLTIFCLPAKAGSAKNPSYMVSSASFWLDLPDVSPTCPRNQSAPPGEKTEPVPSTDPHGLYPNPGNLH